MRWGGLWAGKEGARSFEGRGSGVQNSASRCITIMLLDLQEGFLRDWMGRVWL